MTRFFCNSVGDICEALSTPIAQKQLTGIRGLMNLIASWSGREIDPAKNLHLEHYGMLLFGHEAKHLEELLNAARVEVSAEQLKRLRTQTSHHRCELVMSLADELKADLVELFAWGMLDGVEEFAKEVAKHNWKLVASDLDRELELLATPATPPGGTPEKTQGAVSQGVFAYNGKRAEGIEAVPWGLLEFMEGKQEADIDDAYRHAIGDESKDATDGAVKAMLNKANNALLIVNYPKTLSKTRRVRKIVWLCSLHIGFP